MKTAPKPPDKMDIPLNNPKVRLKVSYITLAIIIVIVIFLLILFLVILRTKSDGENGTKFEKTVLVTSTIGDKKEELNSLYPVKPGVVCSPTGDFSFLVDVSYSPLSEDKNHIALNSNSGLLVISKKSVEAEEIFKKYNINYKKEGNFYVYQLTNALDPGIPKNSPVSAQSLEKDEFIISLFYDPDKKDQSTKTLDDVFNTIKEGCKNG